MASVNSAYFLASERIGIRRWHEDDLPLARQLWGNPDVTRLFKKEPMSEIEVVERLNTEIENGEQHHIQYWPIFYLCDNQFLGCAGLRPYADSTLELGVHLRPEHWGRGLATEAGRLVIGHAFQTKLAPALFAGHHPANKASRDLLLKLGFLGTKERYYRPTDLFHPSYLLYDDKPAVSTRPATVRDARALAIVHCHSIKETFSGLIDDYVAARSLEYCEKAWERRFSNNECTTLALLLGEQIVGFASVAPAEDTGLIGRAGMLDRIYIHPSAWGHGHGKVLIEWCEQAIKSMGLGQISLWVFEVNSRARHVYEKHGYQLDGVSKEDFNARILRYSKQLS